MSIFTIADLHLAFGVDKPMDVFGGEWVDYMEKIDANWRENVKENDTVIIPGDISWAMRRGEVIKDLKYIDSLPGRKVLLKGNHEYWWESMAKLNQMKETNNLENIFFLFNNAIEIEDKIICGTRGWKLKTDKDFTAEDLKIYNRELGRLELSLEAAGKLSSDKEKIVFIHYPPFDGEENEFVQLMNKYGVKRCYYGHLHGVAKWKAFNGEAFGIEFNLVSGDFIGFSPVRID